MKDLLPLELAFHEEKLEVLALLDDKDKTRDHERDQDYQPSEQ